MRLLPQRAPRPLSPDIPSLRAVAAVTLRPGMTVWGWANHDDERWTLHHTGRCVASATAYADGTVTVVFESPAMSVVTWRAARLVLVRC